MARLILDQKTSSVFHADALDLIEYLPDNSIQTVITSPTYWGKRKFSDDKREFGSESLKEYIEKNVNLYSKILKKLKDTGSLFIVIQDSYMGSGISRSHHNHWEKNKNPEYIRDGLSSQVQGNISSVTAKHSVIANKSLCAIPYRIAIKLVDQGYIWRQQIIWEKPNPMPENVKDRLRQSSEYILHFVKSRIYKFNSSYLQIKGKNGKLRMMNQVWIATPEPKKGHTATFPTKIVEKLLLATSDEGDLVFEPFLGSGTMYDLSMKHKRCFIGADISLTLLLLFLKRAPPSGIQKLRDSEHRCAVAEDHEPPSGDTESLVAEGSGEPSGDSSKCPSGGLELTLSKKLKLNLRFNPLCREELEIKEVEVEEGGGPYENFIRNFSEFFENNVESDVVLSMNPKFKSKLHHKSYQFRGLLTLKYKQIALEIPSIKSFDTNKGAGSYYAAVRLNEALKQNLINGGILFLPNSRAVGGKFQDIIKSNRLILPLNLSQLDVENIINKKYEKLVSIDFDQWINWVRTKHP